MKNTLYFFTRFIVEVAILCILFTTFLTQNAFAAPSDDFVITVKTDNLSYHSSSNTQFRIYTYAGYLYDYNVDCDNDGIDEATHLTGDYICNYPQAGTYTVRIKHNDLINHTGFPGYKVGYDRNKVISIDQWGTSKWQTMRASFNQATYVTGNYSDTPDTSGVTDMGSLFRWARHFDGEMNSWDTSNVTNMAHMFEFASAFNHDISSWNTSSVTDMSWMFRSAGHFNQDIGNWNTSNVTNMNNMFNTAVQFNQDISFKPGQGNGGGDAWNTSQVTDMSSMFYRANSFNYNINNWNTSQVTNMERMFYWTSFNQPLNNWDISQVSDISEMFYKATSFNQDLSSWHVDNVTTMVNTFQNSGMSTQNYDNTIIGWSNRPNLQNNVQLDSSAHYCQSETERNNIITTYNWTINDAGKDCTPTTAPDLQSGSDTGSSQTDNITSTTTPTFDIQCRVSGLDIKLYVGGNLAETHTCVGTGTESITLTNALTEGSHNITYTETENGIETNQSPSLHLTIDQTTPNLTVAVDTQNPHSVDNPQITFSATDNINIDHYEVTYIADNGGAGVSGTTTIINPATSPVNLNLDSDENLHTVMVVVYDVAGNSTTKSLKFPPTINFQSPYLSNNNPMTTQVVITSPLGNNIDNITISNAGGTGATLGSCTGGQGGGVYSSPTTCDINNITSTGLIEITARDTGINVTGKNSQTYTIDTTDPVITITAPTKLKNSSITDTTIQVTDNNGITASNVNIDVSSSVTTSNFNCTQTTSTQVDCTISIDGPTDSNPHNLIISVTDDAGNQLTQTESNYIIDTTAPSTPSTADLQATSDTGTSDSDNITSDNTPTFDVVCSEANSTITLYSDGNNVGTYNCAGAGIVSITTSSLSDGSHDITYTETDQAGNESNQSSALFVTVDTQLSPTSTINIPTNGAPVSGTAEPGATVTLSTPSGAMCTTTVDNAGNYSCTLNPSPTDGENITAVTTDIAGNTDAPGVTENGGVDTNAPTLTMNAITAGATTITGTGDPGATITISPNICSNAPITVDASGNWTCTITAGSEPQANDTITATSTDGAGNTATVTYTVPQAQSHHASRRLPREEVARIFGYTEQQSLQSTKDNPLGGNLCSSNLTIHNFMKKGDRDGYYSSYNKGKVTEIKLLQSHINRILKNDYTEKPAGPEDGIFGILTQQGVKRLQTKLNELLKGIIEKPLIVDGIVGPYTREAINHSC